MKKGRTLSLLRLLMIISQVLLLLLVAEWLRAVYTRESDRYNHDFALQFRESGMAVIDSMLMENIITPVMKDSTYRQMTMNITVKQGKDTNPAGQQGLRLRKEFSDTCRNVFAFVAKDTFSGNDSTCPPRKMEIYSSDQLFLKGIRMFVQRIEDSLSFTPGVLAGLLQLKDTARMKQIFSLKLYDTDPVLRIKWTTTPVDSTSCSLVLNEFHYQIPASGRMLGATVQNHTFFLIKQMTSSILFALVLVILTATSFVIAFRSLKKQILLNRMRSSFISNITHELKTPVSTVKVALEALKKYHVKDDPAVTAEYLDMAAREMNRLDLLISQVLNNSLHENGTLVTVREPADLGRLVSEVIALLQPQINEKRAHVTVEQEGTCIISADSLHVHGVLANLLDNSLKYGGERPEITILLTESPGAITVRITDKGPGIPEEFLGRIFEKFFRIPSDDRHNIKGYGLGLSYAAMIMKEHGGSITAANHPGGGMTFTLTFPTTGV